MSYSISFTDSTNPLKQPLVVPDKGINNQTSLVFVGKNYSNYGTYVGENFLHIMENFASSSSPTNPVQGQLWFDTSSQVLKVNLDGTESNWAPTGSVHKATLKPSVASAGDIWVDTINQQLYIYTGSGSSWTLIGPQYTQGSLTGQVVETVKDVNNIDRYVLSIYADNFRVGIVSASTFIPKSKFSGFSKIHKGFTLVDSTNPAYPDGVTTSEYRFWGTAKNADTLNGISADLYVRKNTDVVFDTDVSLSVQSINLGNDYNLHISTDDLNSSKYLISSQSSNSSLEIRLKNEYGSLIPVALFQPNGNVGINFQGLTRLPSSTLDVNGDITSKSLLVTNVTDINDPSQLLPSIKSYGGASINKSVEIGGDLNILNGTMTLSLLDSLGDNMPGEVILPGMNNLYDIGSETLRFRNIYASNITGDVYGNVYGTLVSGSTVDANVSGSAGSLSTTANMSLAGDISSNTVQYDGSQNIVTFTTVANNDLIASKTELNDPSDEDRLLLYREYAAQVLGYISGTTLSVGRIVYGDISPGMTVVGTGILTGTTVVSQIDAFNWTISNSHTIGTPSNQVVIRFGSSGLYQTTRAKLLQSVPLVRAGSVMMYPGTTAPSGYLKCDGQTYYIVDYPDLYNALGSTYLVGTTRFNVPNISAPVPNFIYIICTGL